MLNRGAFQAPGEASQARPAGERAEKPAGAGSRAAVHQKEAGRGFGGGRGGLPRLSAPLRILRRRFSAFRPFYTYPRFLAPFSTFLYINFSLREDRKTALKV